MLLPVYLICDNVSPTLLSRAPAGNKEASVRCLIHILQHFRHAQAESGAAANLHPKERGFSMSWLFFVVALAAGAANPLQSGMNAQLNKQLASPLWAGLTVYATGFGGLLLLQLVLRQAFPASRAGEASAWAWPGGLVSIASTMAGLMLAQKLGSGVFTGLTITASVVVSALLDHYGWVGFQQHALTPMRTLGCGLMIAGVWLVARF